MTSYHSILNPQEFRRGDVAVRVCFPISLCLSKFHCHVVSEDGITSYANVPVHYCSALPNTALYYVGDLSNCLLGCWPTHACWEEETHAGPNRARAEDEGQVHCPFASQGIWDKAA